MNSDQTYLSQPLGADASAARLCQGRIPGSTDRADKAAIAPFFIVGSGRCGSTLLRMMLASHSQLSIPPETRFLVLLAKHFSIERPLTEEEIESVVSTITGHDTWPDLKLDAQEFRRRVGKLIRPHVGDVAEVVYRCYMEAEGKPRWGDKSPIYITIVPELARMFPTSRFIHVVRDGRDVAKSFQATPWRGRWLHDSTGRWIQALKCQRRWDHSEVRNRILLIRYEELVLKTEPRLREICRFIGEEFEPNMLSWERKVDEQVPERARGVHTKLKLKIGAEGVARWKRELSRREIFVCEAFMAPLLARFGYERCYTSRLWVPAFAVTRWYCHAVLSGDQFVIRAIRFVRKRLTQLVGFK
jgi:hypothetical protein